MINLSKSELAKRCWDVGIMLNPKNIKNPLNVHESKKYMIAKLNKDFITHDDEGVMIPWVKGLRLSAHPNRSERRKWN